MSTATAPSAIDTSPPWTAAPTARPNEVANGRRFRLSIWSLAYALLCVGLLSVGLETAIHFNGPPIDGPFQLYNALRRIAAGQHIGVDFQFFHGAGVPYLHYLPFRLFGGGFFASEIARQVVSVTLFALTFVVVFFAWTRDWLSTMRLSLAATLATILLRLDAIYLPVNSLLGVRSTMPILFATALTVSLSPARRSILAGLVLGGALLLGTEQGLAVIAALVGAEALLALRTRRWRAAAEESALTIGVGAVTYVLVVTILARGLAGLRSAAAYNFRLVPMDQFWYFGGPPNRFLSRLHQLGEFNLVWPWMLATLLVTIGVLVRLWRTPEGQDDRRRLGEAVMGIYATMSMASILGTLVTVYLEPAMRVVTILVLLAVHRAADRLPLVRSRNVMWREWRGVAGILALLMLTMYMRFGALEMAALGPLHITVSHIIGGDPPTFSPPWRDALATGRRVVDEFEAREHRKPVVWSTYSTMLEASEGMFHPSFDYIIHALGPENRRAYQSAFETSDPDIVQTLKPSYAVYEEWLESTAWPMYRDLLRNYQIVAKTEWSYFWERREAPALGTRVVAAGAFPPEQHRAFLNIVAPQDTLTLLQVRMRYHVVNPWRRVPVVGALPRYVVEISGSSNRNAVSLAPYETERTFPIMVHGSSTVGLQFSTIALAGPAQLVVDSLQVSELGIPPGAAVWARSFAAPRANSVR
jgi:hypothetical protein